MNVLVTGATGFVGRALTARLVADGFQVRAAVRTVPPGADPRVEWCACGDLGGPVDWQRLLAGVDAVVHLAALAHQVGRAGEGRAAEFMFVNGEITRRLAAAARIAGVHRFVLPGSVAVVGTGRLEMIDESTPAQPDTDYGRSKLEAERALARELDGSDVSWVVLRAPLVYGPGNPGNMERLLRLIASGATLPFGAITNARSFLFIDNLVDAIVTTLRAPSIVRGVYFVDDGSRFSTPGLCRALAAAAHLEARVVRVPLWLLKLAGVAGDLAGRLLRRSMPIDRYSVDRLLGTLAIDGGRFRAESGWRPPVPVEAAIRRTVESVTRSGGER